MSPLLDLQELVSEAEAFGALGDISILDTDEQDWQRVLDHVASSHDLRFTVDGPPAPLPAAVADLFAIREQATTTLLIEPDGIRLACHFFASSEIEFAFDPRDVKGEREQAALLAFLRTLRGLVRKPVVVTPEGDPDAVALRLEPARQPT